MKKYFINEDWELNQFEDYSQIFLLIVEQSLPMQSYIHHTANSPEELVPLFKQLVDQYKDVAIDEIFQIYIVSLPNTKQIRNIINQVSEITLTANKDSVELIDMLISRADCEILCSWKKEALCEKAANKTKKRRKKPYNSMSYTTGCQALNIDFFNSHFGSGNIGDTTCSDSGCFNASCESSSVGESLVEAKRYVKRYYIRPQNIFCSNKAEILQALVQEVGESNCSVYSLKSLADHDDVHLLKPSDIIYYYDEGILYDKNHIKVMDYDLNVKHEEDRKKFANVDAISDDTFDKEYEDRLVENKEESFICCICGEKTSGYGNNPAPVAAEGNCCNACNIKFVIPARLETWIETDAEKNN